MNLESQIDELAGYIDRAELVSPDVSGWSVGQQIEHSLLSIRTMVAAIGRTSDGSGPESSLTAIGRLVLMSGQIPRGRGQAPASVTVEATPNEEHLLRSVEKARSAIARLDEISDAGVFDHPYFGVLDKKRTIRFIEIHTDHHLAIVRDILESA